MKKAKAIEQFLVRLLAGTTDLPVALALVSLIPVVAVFVGIIYRQLTQLVQAAEATLFASGDFILKH